MATARRFDCGLQRESRLLVVTHDVRFHAASGRKLHAAPVHCTQVPHSQPHCNSRPCAPRSVHDVRGRVSMTDRSMCLHSALQLTPPLCSLLTSRIAGQVWSRQALRPCPLRWHLPFRLFLPQHPLPFRGGRAWMLCVRPCTLLMGGGDVQGTSLFWGVQLVMLHFYDCKSSI